MNTKTTLILTLSIFFISFKAQAQIEDEIKSFVDSTEIIVEQGRKMLAKNISENNYDKVKEVYTYLNEKTEDEDCSPFTYTEHMYILTLTSQWEEWVKRAEKYKDYNLPVCYAIKNNVIRSLHKNLIENDSALSKKLNNSNLNNEGKGLISLFLYVAKNDINDSDYGKKLKTFRNTYPDTRYEDFLNNYMPDRPKRTVMRFSIGATRISTTSNLSENFKPKTLANMGFGFDVNKIHGALTFDAGSFALQEPFSAPLHGNDYDFEKGEDFHFLNVGLDLGYFALQTQNFQLAPIIHLGGTVLESKLFDSDSNNDELKLINKFTYGAGILAEVKLFNFTHTNYNFYTQSMVESNSYLGLKFVAGYNKIKAAEYDAYEGDFTYARLSLVYGLGFY